MRAIAIGWAAALAAGCAPGPRRPAAGSAGELEAAFHEASDLFAVPVEVLEGTAWVLSGWSPAWNGEAAFGVMALRATGSSATLGGAARLTGFAPERLKDDARANVLGGAAILREIADRIFALHPELDDRRPGDWWRAVAEYSGYDAPPLRTGFTAQVYRTISRGAERRFPDGSLLRLEAAGLAPDYPKAAWAASPNFTPGRGGRSVEIIVIHGAETTQPQSVIVEFQRAAAGASAHYLVHSGGDAITQLVFEQDTAWHAGNLDYNQRSIGIEHVAWYTEAMYRASAELTRWICDRYGIPKDRQHIVGHNEVPHPADPERLGGASRRRDPGSAWDWERYMDLVLERAPRGPIAEGLSGGACGLEICESIEGAVARLSAGAVTTTDTQGNFALEAPAGRYDLVVEARGFRRLVRHVTVPPRGRAQVWLKLEPRESLWGLVVEAGTFDPVEAAIVRLSSGDATTTDARGEFLFDAASGRYTVTVDADGFERHIRPATVRPGGRSRIWVEMIRLRESSRAGR